MAVDGLRAEEIVAGVVEVFADDRPSLVGHVDLAADEFDLLLGRRPVDDGEALRHHELVGDLQQSVHHQRAREGRVFADRHDGAVAGVVRVRGADELDRVAAEVDALHGERRVERHAGQPHSAWLHAVGELQQELERFAVEDPALVANAQGAGTVVAEQLADSGNGVAQFPQLFKLACAVAARGAAAEQLAEHVVGRARLALQRPADDR